jgi:hypothetical protein
MEKELKDALAEMQTGLEGKSKEQIAEAIKAFETEFDTIVSEKVKGLVGDEVKAVREEMESERKEAIDAMQKHLDAMDIKLQAKKKKGETVMDAIKEGIKTNFKDISQVKRGRGAEFDIKAVGNMTLSASLTGDQYRDYSTVVAANTSHKVNFADLIGVIPISEGIYTFPREGTVEGSIATQTEGSDKSQIDTALSHIDVATDFLAGYAVYSKKMSNNVSYLESFLPQMLRREYLKAESASFYATAIAAATASTQTITGQNKIEMLMNEFATLEALDFDVNAVAMTPADYWDILQIEKSTGAGYGLPGIVTLDGGVLRVNGIAIVRANWVAANKYVVGDWSTMSKVVTEGLSVQFSNEDEDNFRKNNITARIEAQIALAIHRPDALIYGDFTAT